VWKKALGVILGSFVVVGLSLGFCLWSNREGNRIGEVAWSPLYASREKSALVPLTSQVAYGALQTASAPTCVGEATCDETCQQTCDGWTCEGTCDGWTCDKTCEDTCDGYTCEGTCDGYTCEGTCGEPTCQDTCSGYTCEGTCQGWTCDRTCQETCDGYTCEGTCEGWTCDRTCQETCDGYTCEGTCDEYTCEGTCDGYTCEGTCDGTCDGLTCDGTCDGWTCEETCDGETCEGSTCDGGTCEGATCPIPTCADRTCVGPTCAGFATCDRTCDGECDEMTWDVRTCAGPTCDGPSCGDRTCDPWDCGFPTFGAPTCTRPTCHGPTCGGPTCDGRTCFAAACEVWDFGDAPDGSVSAAYHYLTRLQDDGARHLVDGVYYLGVRIDEEPDGQPNDEALGDDFRPWSVRDDEDGVWFPTSLIPGRQAILIVDASEEGFFHGWIDYDENGDWRGKEPEERLFDPSLPLQKGFNWIAFEVPEDADAPETSFARFRFGRQETMAYAGEERNGEVEDYRTALCPRYDVWIMTDDIVYSPGEEVFLDFYVSDVSQIEIIRHRADGTSSLLWAGTVEPGRQEIREHGGVLRALIAGTDTIEMLATSLPTGCSTWVTTPFVVVEP
jgi:hypothetical protein